MVRTVTLLGVAVLTLAAVAMAKATRPAKPARRTEKPAEPTTSRLLAQLKRSPRIPYYAQFSLN